MPSYLKAPHIFLALLVDGLISFSTKRSADNISPFPRNVTREDFLAAAITPLGALGFSLLKFIEQRIKNMAV